MSKNRWLLPDGIDEIVGIDARALESLRRDLLDLFDSWGYDLVIPPIVEFTDSLLTGLGAALEFQTFKFSDQQSGKSLGVRADISPQAARIDAHSIKGQGANRLCYAETVLRSSPTGAFANRAPSQIGAELFGIEKIDADFEIISLMLTALQSVSQREIALEVSHQSVRTWLQQLASNAGLDFENLCTLISEKRLPELDAYLSATGVDSATTNKLRELPRMMGGVELLEKAKKLFVQDSLMVDAISEMQLLSKQIGKQYAEVRLFFNLGEAQFSNYHSGLIFSAYSDIDGVAVKVANGGRYNEVGEAFGRSRPATGFSADLKILAQLVNTDSAAKKSIYVLVPNTEQATEAFWSKVQSLRSEGKRVQLGYSEDQKYLSEYNCDQQLVEKNGDWQLVAINQ